MRRKLFIIVSIFFILLIPSCKTVEQNNSSITSIVFETRGGGDILFDVKKISNQFLVNVNRYNFSDTTMSFYVSSRDIDEYNILQKLFLDPAYIKEFVNKPLGPTGSWSSIILIFGSKIMEIDDIVVEKELLILYEYIVNIIESK